MCLSAVREKVIQPHVGANTGACFLASFGLTLFLLHYFYYIISHSPKILQTVEAALINIRTFFSSKKTVSRKKMLSASNGDSSWTSYYSSFPPLSKDNLALPQSKTHPLAMPIVWLLSAPSQCLGYTCRET